MYVGLRWEGIRTTSTSSGADVSNTSRVWSPVLHTVWRIPGHEKDQIRAALTQSYRAPALNDLIATPSFSTDNRPTRPDRIGNPNLKPELAKGLDLAYEHYLGKSGIVSASAFVRDIDNLMRRTTTQRQTSRGLRWVSSPVNIGHAITSGIELEAKFPLTEVMAGAPNIDLRSNYSRFWSRVDGIQGPNNRLDQQASQTANFGLDYRMKDLPLTLGGGYNWTPAILVQTTHDRTGQHRRQAPARPVRTVEILRQHPVAPGRQQPAGRRLRQRPHDHHQRHGAVGLHHRAYICHMERQARNEVVTIDLDRVIHFGLGLSATTFFPAP